MPALYSTGAIPITASRGKYPLPAQLSRGRRILAAQRAGKRYGTSSLGEIGCVKLPHGREMKPKVADEARWKRCPPILRALPSPNSDLRVLEVDVLDAQGQRFEKAQNPLRT
jgi:hypothetical protein